MSPPYASTYSASHALIIGINAYSRVAPLSFAAADAVAVADILQSRFGFPPDNVSLLLDSQATGERIRQEYARYTRRDRLRPDDRLLVFFAGHGHTASGSRGEVGFLVPADGHPSEIESLIRWDEWTRNSELILAKHVFFIMDACYGGLALHRASGLGHARFLRDMLRRPGRQVLTAGKADEVVADGNGVRPGHSIFTAHLLNALEGGAMTDGVITANGVMSYVYERVGRDSYSHQTPHFGFFQGDGDFVFDTAILQHLSDADDAAPDVIGERDILVTTHEPMVIPPLESSLADRAKGLIASSADRIRLDDLATSLLKDLLSATGEQHFPRNSPQPSREELIRRVAEYERLTENVRTLAILLARWGTGEQLGILERMLRRLAESTRMRSGLLLWSALDWYPLALILYSAGIAALNSRRYDVLRILLETSVHVEGNQDSTWLGVEVLRSLNEDGMVDNAFKWLPDHERQFVPRSEYLFKILQPLLEDILFLGSAYERLFDEFEVVLALNYAHASDGWGPIGRFGWKTRAVHKHPFALLTESPAGKATVGGLISAGMFDGSDEHFQTAATAIKKLLSSPQWAW